MVDLRTASTCVSWAHELEWSPNVRAHSFIFMGKQDEKIGTNFMPLLNAVFLKNAWCRPDPIDVDVETVLAMTVYFPDYYDSSEIDYFYTPLQLLALGLTGTRQYVIIVCELIYLDTWLPSPTQEVLWKVLYTKISFEDFPPR